MSLKEENTKRVAKNTLLLYVRMFIAMLIGLYTSRVILNALGVVDYGIYNVVGGLVAMFNMVSNALTSGVSRFTQIELGHGDRDKLKKVFSTSMWIMIFLSVIILVLTETIGLWFLNYKMVIPHERIFAANIVYQGSIFSFIIGLFTVPYNSIIIAHERMSAFAAFGILQVLLNLGNVLFVAYAPISFDKLIVYALLSVSIEILMRYIYYLFCKRHFEESRFTWIFDKPCWKEMSSFSIWIFIGSVALTLKDQGVNLILNLFYGPILNAARSIAITVSNSVNQFCGNFMTAVNPQIMKSYASNDLSYMHSLIERGARFSFYILLIIAIPFFFETDFILTLWLKHYPDHTIWFVRLVLLCSMTDVLSNTLTTAQNANGNMRNYQIVTGITVLLNFPFSYLLLRLGMAPEFTIIVAIFLSFVSMVERLYFVNTSAHLQISSYLKNVLLNIIFVTVLSLCIPVLIYYLMQDGFIRFFVLSLASIISTIFVVFNVGCTKNERNFLLNAVTNKVRTLISR
jgi:O-antigen/teichoic acid export membrane protein